MVGEGRVELELEEGGRTNPALYDPMEGFEVTRGKEEMDELISSSLGNRSVVLIGVATPSTTFSPLPPSSKPSRSSSSLSLCPSSKIFQTSSTSFRVLSKRASN